MKTTNDILSLQANLITLGLLELPVTGRWDGEMAEAVESFKSLYEIEEEGCGPKTRQTLSRANSLPLPGTVNLPVPFIKPKGCSALTCALMLLSYLGVPGLGEHSDYNPHLQDKTTIDWLFRIFGYQIDFNHETPWSLIKAHLSLGNPVIVAGYFNRGNSLHCVVLRGYNAEGFWVNDPSFGENSMFPYKFIFSRSPGLTQSIPAHLPILKNRTGPNLQSPAPLAR